MGGGTKQGCHLFKNGAIFHILQIFQFLQILNGNNASVNLTFHESFYCKKGKKPPPL